MANGKSNKKVRTRINSFSRMKCLLGEAMGLLALFSLLIGASRGIGGETPLTEYQVKALFLFNFTRYVGWPDDAYTDMHTSIVIGVLGENNIEDGLNESVKGKSFNGREIVIRHLEKEDDLGKCHILFIGASEKKNLDEILLKTKAKPVLTVGETEHFIEQGGVINFIRKEGKIRLEINVDSATQSGLQISSKLLSVADVVRGKR